MFGRALNPPQPVFLRVNIIEFPYSYSVAKIRIPDLGEMFHNVVMKSLYCLLCSLIASYIIHFFANHIPFYGYCKTVPLQDKITSKLVFLNFLYFVWLTVNFFTIFDIDKMLMNYTLINVLY